MGEFVDKAKGYANQAAGNVKDAVGEATDNRSLEHSGEKQRAKGEAQKLSGDIKGALGDKV